MKEILSRGAFTGGEDIFYNLGDMLDTVMWYSKGTTYILYQFFVHVVCIDLRVYVWKKK